MLNQITKKGGLMVSVSVLLASNKVGDFFHQAVNSIIDQSFKDLELIIVLNGPAASEKIALEKKLSEYPNIKLLSTNISGLNFALNFGMNYASGKYIARMDADDIAYPDRISTQFKFLEKNSDISVCGSWSNLIDPKGLIQSTKIFPTTNLEIRKSLTFKNPICHPSVMYRKEPIFNVGAYLNGKYAEDYDLWVRLSRNPNIGFANIEKPMLGYRSDSDGKARRSRLAYASVSATQWEEFILSGRPKWLLAAIISSIKAIFWGK
jgi:glycosyltransferase involved in cell wall biosynthesis